MFESDTIKKGIKRNALSLMVGMIFVLPAYGDAVYKVEKTDGVTYQDRAPSSRDDGGHSIPVSYTHLTLPTICSV